MRSDQPLAVDLWIFSLNAALDDIEQFASLCSPAEREKFERVISPVERARRAIARGHLRTVLSSYLDMAPGRIAISTGPFGKPQLGGRHSSIAFNVSHSEDVAVIVAGRDLALGVDVEAVTPIEETDCSLFLTAGELKLIAAMAPARRRETIYRFWTGKEAVAKAMGVGLGVPFANIEVMLGSEAASDVTTTARVLDETGQATEWRLVSIAPRNGFVGAIAVPANGRGVVVTQRQMTRERMT